MAGRGAGWGKRLLEEHRVSAAQPLVYREGAPAAGQSAVVALPHEEHHLGGAGGQSDRQSVRLRSGGVAARLPILSAALESDEYLLAVLKLRKV